MGKRLWTKQEEYLLREYWNIGYHPSVIAERLGRTVGAISDKTRKLDGIINVVKPNNSNFKAVYQEYDWCYERYINKGMSHEKMAEEAGCSKRVIEKWCSEKHGLNRRTFREYKKLSEIQKQLVMFSLLGDGHIDKRETQPLFVISHAEDQKDYLYWKHEILKDCCTQEPTYYKEQYCNFGTDREYLCQPFYRFGTRIINDLIPIREMTVIEILNQLNEFGLSLFLLDDASRDSSRWCLCVASYSKEEKDCFIKVVKEKFNIEAYILKDERYIGFSSVSSRKLDEIILRNIPNDLDIIKTKILENDIKEDGKYLYVEVDGKEIGLSAYFKTIKGNYQSTYEKIRDSMLEKGTRHITKNEVDDMIERIEIYGTL